MSTVKIFTTNPYEISTKSFYPRNYSPSFLFVKKQLGQFPFLETMLSSPVTGGSTPSVYLFTDKDRGIPFVKTSAILRHFINVNDLYYINEKFHNTTIKRSITRPYDVIYSMTGKFMGKAALCPPTIPELNMSQNSVVLRTDSPLKSAFLAIFLNSEINRIQVQGTYSITKQKFMNQGRIAKLNIIPYTKEYDPLLNDYLNSIDGYYKSIEEIKNTIIKFNEKINMTISNDIYTCNIPSIKINNKMLLPNFYRQDIDELIKSMRDNAGCSFKVDSLGKGMEIGSDNYTEQGIPFIKTSNVANFGIDSEPNYYCSESYLSEYNECVQKGDIIFTKDGKPGEIAIIEENDKIIISGGFAKYHPKNKDELYWIFLLLSSCYGEACFKKWFVIASTMTHLRKDFFEDFYIPCITADIKNKYIIKLENAFNAKTNYYNKLITSKELIMDKFLNEKCT